MSSEPASHATQRRGVMLILTSPSGAGKSTLSRLLLQKDSAITLSVSATTRLRRPSEVDGTHYHFISAERFDHMRDDGELLEWAEVHGNCYGTPRAPVEKALAEGRDVLFDIDFQGTLQMYERMRADIVSVFILPPTAEALQSRLERRAEDSAQVIRRRLQTACAELLQWKHFDHLLVNDDLDAAYKALDAILTAARTTRMRNPQLGEMAEAMSSGLTASLAPV